MDDTRATYCRLLMEDGTEELRHRVVHHLAVIYPEADLEPLADRVMRSIGLEHDAPSPASSGSPWSHRDAVLITYGDTVQDGDEPPLRVLHRFVTDHLRGAVSAVHVLPFFPYSSDDGFSIIDFDAVREDLGTWDDVADLARDCGLMMDLVCNHVSAESEWFSQFLADTEPGRRYLATADPETDELSTVVRPRTHPLLRKVDTAAGTRHVWCTFSHDQLDLDWSEPDLLCEMLGVIDRYLARGARFLRLDAVAYVWKEPGTPSVHLRQTHELVKLLRTLVDARSPGTVLVTETNVPNRDNLKYFGQGDEAHVIYNFSLPPLVLDALLSGRSTLLSEWMMSMPPAPPGCTYLNFLASHDGIGVRPAEGLLEPADMDRMIDTVRAAGGRVSEYQTPTGPRPYELNVTWWDALAGTHAGPDGRRVERFLTAHAIQLAVEGIPAVYVHSLLASGNDLEGVERRGIARAINRGQLDWGEVESVVHDPASERGRAFHRLVQLLRTRAGQPAFHPDATQFTLHLGPSLFGCWRQSRDRRQSIFAVSNVTDQPQELRRRSLNLTLTDHWFDLLSGEPVPEESWELGPYQTVWITNR